MNDDYKELQAKVVAWAEARRIIPNAKPATQLMKGISEFGELCEAELDIDIPMVIDGIGDTIVTLIIYTNLRGIPFSVCSEIAMRSVGIEGTPREELQRGMSLFGKLCDYEIKNQQADIEVSVTAILTSLYSFAAKVELDVPMCLAAAYDEIKDRKGTLMPNGVFVKEA